MGGGETSMQWTRLVEGMVSGASACWSHNKMWILLCVGTLLAEAGFYLYVQNLVAKRINPLRKPPMPSIGGKVILERIDGRSRMDRP